MRENLGELLARESIIEVAKPMERAIIQGAFPRCEQLFQDPYKPLQFVHFSDVHSIRDHWDRIMMFINYYEKYLSFGIHTGDSVSSNIDGNTDLYRLGTPTNLPVLNCLGNHDKYRPSEDKPTKAFVRDKIFGPMENWDVTYMDCDASMTYYKDFPGSNIRLIVLDLYYDQEQQVEWLRDLLARSKEEGVHVITAMHQPTAELVDCPPTTFHTYMDWSELNVQVPKTVFEDTIGDFVADGGKYICNLCGHHHYDMFGYTERGVLNVAVEMATCWAPWDDTGRVFDTPTYDCFNVMSVDVNTGIFRIARIGNNVDYFLRQKHVLCFDYLNRKMVYTD